MSILAWDGVPATEPVWDDAGWPQNLEAAAASALDWLDVATPPEWAQRREYDRCREALRAYLREPRTAATITERP